LFELRLRTKNGTIRHILLLVANVNKLHKKIKYFYDKAHTNHSGIKGIERPFELRGDS
jgi:hypothetical protein